MQIPLGDPAPVLQRNLIFQVDPIGSPRRTGLFVFVPVVALLHHKINTSPAVAIIVIVALPQRAERVDRGFPVVAEVVSQHFKVGTIQITSKGHPAKQRLAIVDNCSTMNVDHRFTVCIFDLHPGVAEIPVKLSVVTEQKRVCGVIMLRLSCFGEQRNL